MWLLDNRSYSSSRCQFRTVYIMSSWLIVNASFSYLLTQNPCFHFMLVERGRKEGLRLNFGKHLLWPFIRELFFRLICELRSYVHVNVVYYKCVQALGTTCWRHLVNLRGARERECSLILALYTVKLGWKHGMGPILQESIIR